MKKVLNWFCLAFVIVAFTACSGEGPQTDGLGFINTLPDFPQPAVGAKDEAVASPEFDYSGDTVCSNTTYEISDAPKEVVMFSADPQVFWPGALIQGKSYVTGSPQLIPTPNRAALNISVQGLYALQSSAFDVTPTQSSVNQAVQGLLGQAVQDEVATTQNVFFHQEESYSFEQAALKLGFSARYLGSRVKGSLNYETTSETNTIVANATIRTFTVSVDPPTTPSAFFEGMTQEELNQQIALGRMSEDNLPVYVASVTYGQIMMFSSSSAESMSKLKGALSASFNSFSGGGSAKLTAEQEKLLQNSDITVVTLGGSEDGVKEIIKEGRPAEFFTGSTVVTSSVPIAYTLKDLKGNVVQVAELSSYQRTACTLQGTANVYVANYAFGYDGLGSVTGYFENGRQANLATPIKKITETDLPPQALAYNSADDLIHVLVTYVEKSANRNISIGGIFAYKPDGTRESNDFFALAYGETKDIAYDRNFGRLYGVGDFDESRVAFAVGPDGLPLQIDFFAKNLKPNLATELALNPTAVTYDAKNDRVLIAVNVTGENAQGGVIAFDARGNQLELSGDFEGLSSAEGIAYDANNDRIYVSDAKQGSVKVFDTQGNPMAFSEAISNLSEPQDISFHEALNRLYVIEKGASLLSVFNADGTEVSDLERPSFPKLDRPVDIVLRSF